MGPKISSFFFPSRHSFHAFLPLLLVLSWNFGGVFEAPGRSNVHVWSSLFTRQPQNPNVHIRGSRPSKTTPKLNARTCEHEHLLTSLTCSSQLGAKRDWPNRSRTWLICWPEMVWHLCGPNRFANPSVFGQCRVKVGLCFEPLPPLLPKNVSLRGAGVDLPDGQERPQGKHKSTKKSMFF